MVTGFAQSLIKLGELNWTAPNDSTISVYTNGAYDPSHASGDKLSVKRSSQLNKIHARIAILNKFTEFGRPYTQGVT